MTIAILAEAAANLDKQQLIIGGSVAAAVSGGAYLVKKFRDRRESVDSVLARVMGEQIRIELAHHCKFVPHHRERACIQRAGLYLKAAHIRAPYDLKSRVRKLLENA